MLPENEKEKRTTKIKNTDRNPIRSSSAHTRSLL